MLNMDTTYFPKEICGIISNYCLAFLSVCDKGIDIFPFIDNNILYHIIDIDTNTLEVLLSYPKFNPDLISLKMLLLYGTNGTQFASKKREKTRYIRKLKILLKNNGIAFDDKGKYLLEFALFNNKTTIMRLLLENKNVDLNCYPDILEQSCILRKNNIVKLLLYDKRIQSNINNDILRRVCFHENIECVKYILDRKNIDPSYGNNIILRHLLCYGYNIEIVKILTENKKFKISDELLKEIIENRNTKQEVIDLLLNK